MLNLESELDRDNAAGSILEAWEEASEGPSPQRTATGRVGGGDDDDDLAGPTGRKEGARAGSPSGSMRGVSLGGSLGGGKSGFSRPSLDIWGLMKQAQVAPEPLVAPSPMTSFAGPRSDLSPGGATSAGGFYQSGGGSAAGFTHGTLGRGGGIGSAAGSAATSAVGYGGFGGGGGGLGGFLGPLREEGNDDGFTNVEGSFFSSPLGSGVHGSRAPGGVGGFGSRAGGTSMDLGRRTSTLDARRPSALDASIDRKLSIRENTGPISLPTSLDTRASRDFTALISNSRRPSMTNDNKAPVPPLSFSASLSRQASLSISTEKRTSRDFTGVALSRQASLSISADKRSSRDFTAAGAGGASLSRRTSGDMQVGPYI